MNVAAQKSPLKGLVAKLIVPILVLAGVGYWFLFQQNQSPKALEINTSAYHAVFMSNGQVYFGKLTRVNAQFATIEDVFYLRRLEQPLQPISDSDQAPKDAQPQPDLQLVKLGGEVHGPTDRMIINREHILFIEELKENSRVVETIKKDTK